MAEAGTPSRIAYVAGVYPSLSETFVYREVLGLRARGWPVETVTLRRGEEPVAGVREADLCVYPPSRLVVVKRWVAAMGRSPGRTARTVGRALRDAVRPGERLSVMGRAKLIVQGLAGATLGHRLADRGVTHVHCHFAHAPASVGMYAAMHAGVGFSFTGHANDLFERRSLLKRKLERAAFIICISDWHRRFYLSIEPGASARCALVRCGVDTTAWRASKAEREDDGGLRLVTVGRLVPKKGIDTLLRALGEMASNVGETWRLDIYGDGPQRQTLERLSEEGGLSAHVSFHGAVDNDEVRRALAKADLLVLPCRADVSGDRDGIPVVLMEAMACGVAVVAGDVTAIRELIDHEDTGVLVPPDDPSTLARELQDLATNARRRRRLADAGRAAVQREFDLSRNLDRLEQALSACVQQTTNARNPTDEPAVLSHQPVSQ